MTLTQAKSRSKLPVVWHLKLLLKNVNQYYLNQLKRLTLQFLKMYGSIYLCIPVLPEAGSVDRRLAMTDGFRPY